MSEKTPEGLPRVTKDQFMSFLYDQEDNPLEKTDYYSELIAHLEQTNPQVYDFISKSVVEFPSEYHNLAATGFLDIYDLLRRQAEANNLEKKLEE